MYFLCKSFLYLLFFIVRLFKASDTIIMPGTIIDKYEIKREIMSGTEAHVYLAIDDLKKCFAIKVYKSCVKIDQLFDLEKSTRRKLKHYNILLPIQYITTKKYKISIMKYYKYDLFEYKRLNENIPLCKIREIMKQILDGVNFLKQNDVLHNDLKLENILINNSDVVIIDFGLATNETYPFKLIEGNLDSDYMEMFSYYAPEVLKGDYVSHKSDIWCCGVIFYDLISSGPFDPNNIKFKSDDSRCIQLYKSMVNNIPELRLDVDVLLLTPFFSELYSFIDCLLKYRDFSIKLTNLNYNIEKIKNKLICKQENKNIYIFKCFCHNKKFCNHIHKYESMYRQKKIDLIYYTVTDSSGSRLIQHATIDIIHKLRHIYTEMKCFKKK